MAKRVFLWATIIHTILGYVFVNSSFLTFTFGPFGKCMSPFRPDVHLKGLFFWKNSFISDPNWYK